MLGKEIKKKIVNSLTAIWYGGNGNYKIQTIVSMNSTKKKHVWLALALILTTTFSKHDKVNIRMNLLKEIRTRNKWEEKMMMKTSAEQKSATCLLKIFDILQRWRLSFQCADTASPCLLWYWYDFLYQCPKYII